MPARKDQVGQVPPRLTFARVPEGKTVKNRLHLDINPADREQDEKVRRLIDLGLDAPMSAKAKRAGSSLPARTRRSSAFWCRPL